MEKEKDYYYKSIEFRNVTKGLSTSEVKELNHPFVQGIPIHLYKYRKSGNLGRRDFYIKKRMIYTCSFNKLGDRFEGITPATKERMTSFDGKTMWKFYKEPIINILKENFPTMNLETANIAYDIIVNEEFDEDKIYKKLSKMLDNAEEKKRLKTVVDAFCYLFEGMDTKMGTNSEFAKGMKMLMDINDELGAYCMCDSPTNEKLWSLYADDFHGYCIEYDLTSPCKSSGSIKLIKSLYPVRYVEKKDDDWFKPLFEMAIKAIKQNGKPNRYESELLIEHWTLLTLCSKKNIWADEKEWRVIGKADSSYLGPLVSSIIVGHDINKEEFLEIKSYADKNNFPLKITGLNYNEKYITIRDLTQEDVDRILERK